MPSPQPCHAPHAQAHQLHRIARPRCRHARSQPGTRTLPLLVMCSANLEASQVQVQVQVQAAGGTVTQPVFRFPGGRRFHLRNPAGSDLAVRAAQ